MKKHELAGRLNEFNFSTLPIEIALDVNSPAFLQHLRKKVNRYAIVKTKENFTNLGRLICEAEEELYKSKPRVAPEDIVRANEIRELRSCLKMKKPELQLELSKEEVERNSINTELFGIDLSIPTSVLELKNTFDRLLQNYGQDGKVTAKYKRGCQTCGDYSITLEVESKESIQEAMNRVTLKRKKKYEEQMRIWNKREELIKKYPTEVALLNKEEYNLPRI